MDNKGINLMPEDLRSKEEQALSKKDKRFHIDLVVPEGVEAPKEKKQGPSFWQKLVGAFKKKPHFGDSVKAPKEKKEEPKKKKEKKKKHHEAKIDVPKNSKDNKQELDFSELHLPKEEPKITEQKIKVGKDHIDFSLPEPGNLKKEKKEEHKGPSFWDKLKAKFAKKPKAPKKSKVDNKAAANSILLKGNGHDPKPEPVQQTVPPTPDKLEQSKPEPVQESERDFSIPELAKEEAKLPPKKDASSGDAGEPKKKDKKEDKSKEDKTPKFHQPEPNIRARFVENGGGVDLIPTAAKTRSWNQVSRLVAIALVGSVAVLGIFYGVLFVQEKNIKAQQEKKDQQISEIEKQMLAYEDMNDDITALGEEIRMISEALDKHIYWTNFFSMLEKYTVAEVTYHGLTAGTGGALNLQASADSFDVVARQLKVLQSEGAKDDFVSMASVLSAARNGNEEIEFEITLVLNADLFYYTTSTEEIIDTEEGQGGEEDSQ